MGWNEPNQNKDPWGNKQPPDLDEALKKLHAKIKKAIFGKFGKSSKNNSSRSTGSVGKDNNKNNSPTDGGSGILILAFLGLFFILWLLSGIFIVHPAEKAVILRFGKYVETVGPGPHWIPRFISTKIVKNVERVVHYTYSAQMLTQDENLVSVALVVHYRIGDLENYLFNTSDPEESLKQATSSALRQVIGQTTLDAIITEGREVWGANVQNSLTNILDSYKTGIKIVNVSPQPAQAPRNVQDAFDDAIKAQEDEKRFKDQASAYAARVVPAAKGKAQRILKEADAYAQQVVLRAKGDTAQFVELLPQYIAAPYITQERMYLDVMQNILSRSTKIILDTKAGNVLYLPLEKLMPQKFSVQIDEENNFKTEDNKTNDTVGLRTDIRPGRND